MTRRFNWFFLASPASFFPVAGRLIPWFAGVSALLLAAGLYVGFGIAPDDYQQGSVYRIIYIHVPAAWMSMFIYLVMAGYGVLALTFNTRLSAMMVLALAPTGAWFTVIALITGSIWGRPTWGTYWVWDARLTSELFLLFLYLGVMALHHAHADPRRADRAAALLAIVGAINVPIIYFSVKWWNHAAPGRFDQPHGRAENGDDHADGHAARHGRGLVLHLRRQLHARAHHHPRTRRPRGLAARAASGLTMMRVSPSRLTPHASRASP